MYNIFRLDNIYQGRLKKDEDLYYGLMNVIKNLNINDGFIMGIGSVTKASIAFYNQKDGTYESTHVEEPMEIVSLKGNISLKDDKPFAHLHITLAKRDFTVIGGHLLPDTKVFALEYEILSYAGGKNNIRKFNDDTKLFLWAF